MDDRGRLAQSLTGIARWRTLPVRACAPAARGADGGLPMRSGPSRQIDSSADRGSAIGDAPVRKNGRNTPDRSASFRPMQLLDRWASLLERRLPRAAGSIATSIVIVSSLAYGIVKGDHLPSVAGCLKDARDLVANAAGLRIVSITLTGNARVSREEVLATAGVTGTTSLVFLDAEGARKRLKGNPWIADATVLKLYPRELQIRIRERAAFALWQKDGAVSVIADDGTVLEPYVAPGLIRLPLVVGAGAEIRAKEFLALLDRHPAMRDSVRASVLVSERRWSLRLKNGIEVRL